MRALLAICLFVACAGSPRRTEPARRVEVRGDAWTVAYRLVLDDPAAPRLEGLATITNQTAEDWTDTTLALATASDRIDRDGDKIRDGADLCPGDPEDVDGHHDEDGCPEPDNDADRILDVADTCPSESETYNGIDDEDGCPDQGMLPVTHHHVGIIDWIYFAPGSDVVKPAALPLLEAVAATLRGNPRLRVIEIGGHTDGTERDPWSLSLRRAVAVGRHLHELGVGTTRLTLAPYAATQLAAPGTSAAVLAKSRRVGFVVLASDDQVTTPPPPVVRPAFDRPPPELVDDLRYDLAQPVTVRRGATTTLAILDKPVTASEILLWQPADDIAHSSVHPFRAVRLVNTSGFVLQRGPLEVTRDGRVLGRLVLPRTEVGEIVWLPGELDRTTTIAVKSDATARPLRAVGIEAGELVVEDTELHTTWFTVTPTGLTPPLYLHVRKLVGHHAHTLPPGTLERSDRYVVAATVTPGRNNVTTLVEQRARRSRRSLPTMPWRDLEAYLGGGGIPPDVADVLAGALLLLTELARHDSEGLVLRARLQEAADRWLASKRPLDPGTRTVLDETARAIGQTAALRDIVRARLDGLIAKLPAW